MQKQISTIISLKDRFSKPLLKMSDNVKSLDKETRSSMNRVNRWGKQVEKSVDRALKSTAKWAKRGAIALGGYSIKKGVDATVEMDDYVRKVKAIAGDELSKLEIEGEISDLTMRLGIDRGKIGETMYKAISTGVNIDMDTLSGITEISQKLSLTGFTELEDAVSLLATTGSVFDTKEIEDYQRIADQLLRTQQLGNIEVDEMFQHYGRVSSLTQAIGATFEEQTAAMATMTRLGMTPAEATTGYRAILNAFLKQTSDTQVDMLEKLGLGENFLSAASFQAKGFKNVIGELVEATDGDLDIISTLIPNIRGLTGLTKFLEGGYEEYEWILEDIMGSEGQLDKTYEVMDNSISRNWEKIRKRINEYNRRFFDEAEFGEGLADALSKIADYLDDNEDDIMEKMGNIANGVADFSKRVADGIKTLWDERDKIIDIAKSFFIFYGTIKLFKGVGKSIKAIDDIRKASKGLKLGSIVAGFPLAKVATVVIALYAVGAGVKHVYDNWDTLNEKYPGVSKTIDSFKNKWGELSDFMDEHNIEINIFQSLKDDIYKGIKFIPDTAISIAETIIASGSIISDSLRVVWGELKYKFGTLTFQPKLALEGKVDADKARIDIEHASKNWSDMWQDYAYEYFDPYKLDVEVSEETGKQISGLTESLDVTSNKAKEIKEYLETPVLKSGLLDIDSYRIPVSSNISEERDIFDSDVESIIKSWESVIDVTSEDAMPSVDIENYNSWVNKTDQILSKWDEIDEKLKNPIVGQVFINSIPKGLNEASGIGSNYKGTSNWRGGLTWLHERGAELMDLPGGTRVYPRDKSLDIAKQDGYRMAMSGGTGDSVTNYNFGDMNFTGDISSEVDIDEIGTKVTRRIINELYNL